MVSAELQARRTIAKELVGVTNLLDCFVTGRLYGLK